MELTVLEQIPFHGVDEREGAKEGERGGERKDCQNVASSNGFIWSLLIPGCFEESSLKWQRSSYEAGGRPSKYLGISLQARGLA